MPLSSGPACQTQEHPYPQRSRAVLPFYPHNGQQAQNNWSPTHRQHPVKAQSAKRATG